MFNKLINEETTEGIQNRMQELIGIKEMSGKSTEYADKVKDEILEKEGICKECGNKKDECKCEKKDEKEDKKDDEKEDDDKDKKDKKGDEKDDEKEDDDKKEKKEDK